MSYTGKYALAKHETLALKCEDLERQLDEARELIKQTVNKDCSQCVHNYSNGDGWCGDCNNKLKEKGDEQTPT